MNNTLIYFFVALVSFNYIQTASWLVVDLFLPAAKEKLSHCHSCTGKCDNVTVEECHKIFDYQDVKCLTLIRGNDVLKKCVLANYTCLQDEDCDLCDTNLCNRRKVIVLNNTDSSTSKNNSSTPLEDKNSSEKSSMSMFALFLSISTFYLA